ncbi:hypothetical protein ABT297_14355 [Dactylosporangium sp. NPDC000555]|uniref:hypothetical protein n=1 Tax=Dactylosporangium sp. NPDC000555 TaxID=3154260 RepID=UPI003327625D
MPPALVRPYVRAIPITHVAPAHQGRSFVPPPRTAPPDYRPRHSTAGIPVVPAPAQPVPPTRPAGVVRAVVAKHPGTPRRPGHSARASRPRQRRTPALAWGALLIALAATGMSMRPGELREGNLTAAEPGRPQMVLVPAPAAAPAVPPRDHRAKHLPDAPVPPAR